VLGATAAQIRTNWDIAMWGAGKPFEAANMAATYTLIESRVLLNRSGVLQVDFANPALLGTGVWAPQSGNAPILVAKITPNAGPRYRGRMFAPSGLVDEGDINSSGHILTGTVTALQTRFTAAYNSLVSNSVPPLLLHGPTLAPTAITEFRVNNLVGTMRRRIRR